MSSTVTVIKGSKGIDFTRLTDEIKAYILDPANEVSYVERYLLPYGQATNKKSMIPGIANAPDGEITWYHVNGKALSPIYEFTTKDAYGGAPYGTRNGAWAREQAYKLGIPAGVPIAFCHDDALRDVDKPMVLAYFNAAFTAANPYARGGYGPSKIAKYLNEQYDSWTLPGASSWSGDVWNLLKANLPTPYTIHKVQGNPGKLHPLYGAIDTLKTYTAWTAWLPMPDHVPPTNLPWLKRGSTGPSVKLLQTRLKTFGYKIAIDGRFGRQTERIVKQFQHDRKLWVDGIVGPETWNALKG